MRNQWNHCSFLSIFTLYNLGENNKWQSKCKWSTTVIISTHQGMSKRPPDIKGIVINVTWSLQGKLYNLFWIPFFLPLAKIYSRLHPNRDLSRSRSYESLSTGMLYGLDWSLWKEASDACPVRASVRMPSFYLCFFLILSISLRMDSVSDADGGSRYLLMKFSIHYIMFYHLL